MALPPAGRRRWFDGDGDKDTDGDADDADDDDDDEEEPNEEEAADTCAATLVNEKTCFPLPPELKGVNA